MISQLKRFFVTRRDKATIPQEVNNTALIKWIKIVTDVFDDEKILLIESMPDADSIIVIWFKLLCLAGKQNNSGVFVMSNGLPYTEQMLATIFRRKETVVKMALQIFEQFGMIEIIDNTITIPKWGKHQNFDKLEAKTAYQREYMRDYRAKQKQLASGQDSNAYCKANGEANVSSLDKTRLDKMEILRKDNIVSGASAPAKSKIERHKYGEFEWVMLSNAEYSRLISEYGEDITCHFISIVDERAQISGNKYKWKDWNLTVRKAIREKWGGEYIPVPNSSGGTY